MEITRNESIQKNEELKEIEQMFHDSIDNSYNQLSEYYLKKNKITKENKDYLNISFLYDIVTKGLMNSLNNDINEEEKLFFLKRTKKILLNDKNLLTINNIQSLVSLEELYTQRNLITDITIVSNLSNLIILNSHSNYIKTIPNLQGLINLRLLNLSDNFISDFDIYNIPSQIEFIYFYDNPFFSNISFIEYRYLLCKKFEKLKRVDGLNISYKETLLYYNSTDFIKINLKNPEVQLIIKFYERVKSERENYLKLNQSYLNIESLQQENSAINEDDDEFSKLNSTALSFFRERCEVRKDDYNTQHKERLEDMKNKLNTIKNRFEIKMNAFVSTEHFNTINQRLIDIVDKNNKLDEIERMLNQIEVNSLSNKNHIIAEVDNETDSEKEQQSKVSAENNDKKYKHNDLFSDSDEDFEISLNKNN